MAEVTTAESSDIREHYITRNLIGAFTRITEDKMLLLYFSFLSFVFLMGIIGPEITPYGYDQYLYHADGTPKNAEPPSLQHPLGTTNSANDVLSRVLYGARPTVLTGMLGGAIIIGIGSTIGITAGYYRGTIDDVLMRITDFVFGVPLIPFAIVLLTLLGGGFMTGIVVIGLILWRSSARVLRSQVLQIRERPYVMASKAAGASDLRIIFKHILPNIAPMAVLLFSLGIGYAILMQASLAFIGVVNPFIPSWGVMLRNAYNSGLMSIAWWWSIAPGLLISLTVLSAFLFGRKFVKGVDDKDTALAGGG